MHNEYHVITFCIKKLLMMKSFSVYYNESLREDTYKIVFFSGRITKSAFLNWISVRFYETACNLKKWPEPHKTQE